MLLNSQPRTVSAALASLLLLLLPSLAVRSQDISPRSVRTQSVRSSGTDPLHRALFAENIGQWDKATRLQGVIGSTTVSFTATGVRYFYNVDSLRDGAVARPGRGEQLRGFHLATEFIGASASARVAGERKQETIFNYYLGASSADWHTGARTFGQVRYRDLYDGVDALYYERNGRMKYDFIIAPGKDYRRIALRYAGARKLEVAPDGRLAVSTPLGTVLEAPPYSYQLINGRRVPVEAGYRLLGPDSYGFSLGRHDPRYPVTIDPCLTVEYATYLGGGGYDVVTGMAADSSGNSYAVGFTRAPDFPRIPPTGTIDQQNYVFVTKLSPDGSRIIYSTLIGVAYEGSYATRSDVQMFESIGEDVEVAPDGSAYMAMATNADELPTTSGANQRFLSPDDLASSCGVPRTRNFDSYVARLDGNGGIVWGTYVGGSQNDFVTAATLDPNGHFFLTGITFAPSCSGGNDTLSYPNRVAGTTFHAPGTARGFETFVSEVIPGGVLGFSTLFGGSRNEIATQIATDRAGKVWIMGSTNSNDLVTTADAVQPTRATGIGSSGYDLYLALIDPAARQLVYSTYYCDTAIAGVRLGLGINPHGTPGTTPLLRGFDRQDRRQGLAVAPRAGVITFGGTTRSPGLATTANALQRTRRGPAAPDSASADCFIVSLNYQTKQILAATYLGGSDFDALGGIGYDREGNIVVASTTASRDFPLTTANIQHELLGKSDGVLSLVTSDGGGLSYSTYIGGNERVGALTYEQMVYGTTIDHDGAIYIFGGTNSPDLPVTQKAIFKDNDYYGGYIVKFAPPGVPNIGMSTFVSFPPQACPGPLTREHVIFNAGGVPLTVDSVVFRNKSYFSLVAPPAFPLTLDGCSSKTLQIQFDPKNAPCNDDVYDTLLVYSAGAQSKVARVLLSGRRPCLYFFFDKTQIISNDYNLGKGAIFVFTAFIEGTEQQYMTITPRAGNKGIFVPASTWDKTPLGNGPNLISFNVNTTDTGYFCETFDVTVQPCNRTETLRLCAYIRTGLFSAKRPVDLGVVSCGETNYPLVVRNAGNDTLRLKLLYVGGATPQDMEYDPSILTERKIPAGDSTRYDLHFRPKGMGKREAILVFDTDQGFDWQRQQWVPFTAELDSVEFSLSAASIEGSFGEEVTLPVQYAPIREGRAPTTEITFLTKFDPSMLDVSGVDDIGTLTQGWTVVENVFEPGKGGRVKLKMPAGGTPLTGSGLLTKLRLKVLRGAAISTPLRVELAGASKGCFLARIDSSFAFTLSAECAAYARLLSSTSRLLKQSLPNPAGAFVTIPYTIPEPGGKVTLKIYDAVGQELMTLLDDQLKGGNGEVRFDAGRLAPGLYYYRLTIDGTASDTRTMMIER